MSIYLDTSVVVPLFLPDPFAARVTAFLSTGPTSLLISDFVAAEFASVVGMRVRMRQTKQSDAQLAFSSFDGWVRRIEASRQMQSSDIDDAQVLLRRLDLVLRAPDAIHLAIAQRLGAELATFDARMADCARALGMTVVAL